MRLPILIYDRATALSFFAVLYKYMNVSYVPKLKAYSGKAVFKKYGYILSTDKKNIPEEVKKYICTGKYLVSFSEIVREYNDNLEFILMWSLLNFVLDEAVSVIPQICTDKIKLYSFPFSEFLNDISYCPELVLNMMHALYKLKFDFFMWRLPDIAKLPISDIDVMKKVIMRYIRYRNKVLLDNKKPDEKPDEKIPNAISEINLFEFVEIKPSIVEYIIELGASGGMIPSKTIYGYNSESFHLILNNSVDNSNDQDFIYFLCESIHNKEDFAVFMNDVKKLDLNYSLTSISKFLIAARRLYSFCSILDLFMHDMSTQDLIYAKTIKESLVFRYPDDFDEYEKILNEFESILKTKNVLHRLYQN